MKIIALLPMKAHSERVPNKNIKNFCGKPLYHAVLTDLLQSEHINKVVINTDSTIKSFAYAGGSRIGLKPQMFEINKLKAIDIDEPEDWEIAEILYKKRTNK